MKEPLWQTRLKPPLSTPEHNEPLLPARGCSPKAQCESTNHEIPSFQGLVQVKEEGYLAFQKLLPLKTFPTVVTDICIYRSLNATATFRLYLSRSTKLTNKCLVNLAR